MLIPSVFLLSPSSSFSHSFSRSGSQLYTEDTYEIEGEPFFGYLRGPYTHQELNEIDQYAFDLGIEAVPCSQSEEANFQRFSLLSLICLLLLIFSSSSNSRTFRTSSTVAPIPSPPRYNRSSTI